MATIWCACAETFDGEQEFRTHQWGLSRDKHHRSRTLAEQAPILPGGTLRTECHTTDMQRVAVMVTAEKVKRYGCGCWGVKTTRPGPDMPGPYTLRSMEVFVTPCSPDHSDDGGTATVLTRGQ